MLGRILCGLMGLLAVGLLFGCGDGGASRNPMGKSDEAEKHIKLAEKSAANSCALEYCQTVLRAVEAEIDIVRAPLAKLEAELRAAEGERDNLGAGETTPDPIMLAAVQAKVAALKGKISGLTRRLSPQLTPLEDRRGMLNSMRRTLSKGSKGRSRVGKIVSHEVEALNEKAPGQRTSTMTIKPTAYVEVLGSGEMKFKLTWRRMARKMAYSKKARVSFELARVELISGGKKTMKESGSPVPSDPEDS
jgi:hypothetical protein